MKIIDKLIIEGLVFMVLFAIYMVFADKPFIYKYFWRTYFYVLLYSVPLVLFITVLPMIYSTFSMLLLLSIIIFFSELIVFNILLINTKETDFYNYCTSTAFGYVFAGSIVFLLVASFVIKGLH